YMVQCQCIFEMLKFGKNITINNLKDDQDEDDQDDTANKNNLEEEDKRENLELELQNKIVKINN
ncbi:36887_t:CDS:1, partial [Racocetra persica]